MKMNTILKSAITAIFIVIVFTAGLIAGVPAVPQTQIMEPNLAAMVDGKGWQVINRTVTLLKEDERNGVRFSESGGTAFAWLEDFVFANGTIEFDVRGKNIFQRSFVGVAFHAVDANTYDAVYFRPFNFKAEDESRRLHAVQYISHPAYTWSRLRREQPGEYEKPVIPAPEPDDWFHARIVVTWPKVSVFVNDVNEPSLVVEQLSKLKSGLIGLFVDVGGGDFANFKIQPEATNKDDLSDDTTVIEEEVYDMADPNSGLIVDGMTPEQACLEIVRQFGRAFVEVDIDTIRSLNLSYREYPPSMWEQLEQVKNAGQWISEFNITGQPYQEDELWYVPCKITTATGQIEAPNVRIKFFDMKGRTYCFIIGSK